MRFTRDPTCNMASRDPLVMSRVISLTPKPSSVVVGRRGAILLSPRSLPSLAPPELT